MRLKTVVLFLCVISFVIFFAAAAKDVFIKKMLEDFVQNKTGCAMQMQHFSVSILNMRASIKDLIIFNPPGYEEPILLRAPEVSVDFDVFDYFKKNKIHIYTLVLDVREYYFIRNKRGQVNGDLLLSAFKTENEAHPKNERGQPLVIQIDKLTLRIGKIVSKNYSKEPQPVVQELVFNIDETFNNVPDGYALVEAFIGKEFRESIFPEFFKAGVGKIAQPITKTMEMLKEAGAQAAVKTQQVITETVESGQKSLDAIKQRFNSVLPQQE